MDDHFSSSIQLRHPLAQLQIWTFSVPIKFSCVPSVITIMSSLLRFDINSNQEIPIEVKSYYKRHLHEIRMMRKLPRMYNCFPRIKWWRLHNNPQESIPNLAIISGDR